MKKSLLPFLMMLSLINPAFAQLPDSLKAAEIYLKGDEQYSKKNYDSAVYYYKEAMSLFKSSQLWEGYTRCIYDVGYIAFVQKNYERSDSLFRKGMTEGEARQTNRSFSWVKNCYGRILIKDKKNEFDSILYLANEALAVLGSDKEHQSMKLKLLDEKASTYNRLGIYNNAIETWHKYESVVTNHFEGDEEKLNTAYEQLGYNYGLNRNYIQADGYLNRVLEYRKSNANTSSGLVRLARLYNSIGGAYLRSQRVQESRSAYRKANNIAVQELGENSAGAIYTLANIGLTFIGINEDSAQWYLKKALEKELAHMPNQSFVIGNSYLNLGMTQYYQEKNEEAFDSYKNSLAYISKTTTGFHTYFSKSLNQLGLISINLNRLDSAASYFDKAIRLNIINENVSKDNLSTEISDYLDLHNLIVSIRGKAILLVEHGYKASPESSSNTIDEINKGITLIEKSLRNLSNQESIEDSMNGLLHELILFGGKLTLQLYGTTQDQKYLDQFIGYAEMDRASGLRSLISKEYTIKTVGIPDSIIGKIQSIDHKVELAKSEITRQSSDNAENWKKLQELTERRDRYYSEIEDRYPLFRSLRSESKQINIKDIQEALSSDQILIEYYMGMDSTYAVLLGKELYRLFRISNNETLNDLIDEQRDNAFSQDFSGFNKCSNQLYSILFEDIDNYLSSKSSNANRVIIIPDERIGYVSFSSLSKGGSESGYLIEDYTFSYEPSALVAFNRTANTLKGLNLLGIGSDFSTLESASRDDELEIVRDSLRPLPGVALELDLISNIVPTEVFGGGSATESNFKKSAPEFSVIHLATHAIVDNERPEYSRLYFDSNSDVLEDGALHAYEIYNLQLPAQLVTLSACNTGFGKIKQGEGVMSLSRAFAYAGVPSTVVSLWPASDKSTPELMKYFYQNLKDGQTKDVALNNARKQYLVNAKGKARHPFYWGGFVLIGDDSPIEGGRNLLVYLIPSLIVIVMILTLYRRKKKGS